MAYSYTEIGDYIKSKWGFVKANLLKNNVRWLNAVLGNWHSIDSTALSDATGQGFSKQIRSSTHAPGGVVSANAYGGHIVSINFEKTQDAATAKSYLLDNSIDWRNRAIKLSGLAVSINSLPTEANDNKVGFGVSINSTPTVAPSIMGNSVLELVESFGYTEGGNNIGLDYTANDTRGAPIVFFTSTCQMLFHPSANAGNDADGTAVLIGNLLVTIKPSGTATVVNFLGIIIASPPWA
jgi:hypothetical protein